MHRALFYAVPLLLAAVGCVAQSSSAACNLDDERQIVIRFNPVTSKAEKPVNGRPWTPGGAPMTLFTDTQLTFAGVTIPIGAYTVYPIPAKEKWSLAVNKNVKSGSAYDEKDDLVRAAIETDQVPQAADTLEVAFAHYGSKCTLRIVFGKVATFADFTAK